MPHKAGSRIGCPLCAHKCAADGTKAARGKEKKV